MKTPLTESQRIALKGLAVVAFVVVVAAVVLFATVGCTAARIFQRKVPATDSVAPAAQAEGQKKAAKWIAVRTAPPVQNAPAVVADVHEVAVSLSASLGEPARAVAADDREAVINALASGLRAKEEQLEKWKAFGRKYGGTPLEGTGINLAAGALWLWIVGIIALCVLVPGAPYVVLRIIPALWNAVKRGAQGLERVAASAPQAVEEVKAALPQRNDAARKLIRLAKSRPLILSP